MGILKKHLQLYCKNKLNEKILFEGNTLVIGQQAVYMQEKDAKKIAKKIEHKNWRKRRHALWWSTSKNWYS